MLTCFSDESFVDNGGAEEYKLSIYGGLILKESTFRELTDYLYKIKDNYVLPQELELKWRFETVWDNMKKVGYIKNSVNKQNNPSLYNSLKEDHKTLKEAILDKLASSDAKIVVVIRPNKLLKATDEQVISYSLEAIARKFEKILVNEGEFGIILADELRKKINTDASVDYQYIISLCSRGSGLSLPPNTNPRKTNY